MTAGPEPVTAGFPAARATSRTAPPCPHCGRSGRRKRPKEETTDEQKRASLLRQVNAYSKRVELSGLAALADLVELRRALDNVIDAAVDRCRHDDRYPASWPEVAAATGLSRSAAQERWGGSGGGRKPGGQPGSLR